MIPKSTELIVTSRELRLAVWEKAVNPGGGFRPGISLKMFSVVLLAPTVGE